MQLQVVTAFNVKYCICSFFRDTHVAKMDVNLCECELTVYRRN